MNENFGNGYKTYEKLIITVLYNDVIINDFVRVSYKSFLRSSLESMEYEYLYFISMLFPLKQEV